MFLLLFYEFSGGFLATKEKRVIVSKGSSKILYSLPQDDILLTEFRPEIAIDGKKVFKIKDQTEDCGGVTGIHFCVFGNLSKFLLISSARSAGKLLVKRLNIIPVEVTVRNLASQLFAKRFKHFKARASIRFSYI